MTQHVLSLSYGKDSLACLGAIEQLGWPLDRIIHAEVWATDTIPADLPPMVEFKAKADEIIKRRWGIEVEHVRAAFTYEDIFYRVRKSRKANGEIHGESMNRGGWCQDRLKGGALDAAKKLSPRINGFPMINGSWCNSRLKLSPLRSLASQLNGVPTTPENSKSQPSHLPSNFQQAPHRRRGGEKNTVVQYLGIASDEPERLARLDGITKVSPLAALGWTEADCRKWCEDNDLLSPIYTTVTRGGCWFCHNQGVDQLRLLRKTYPDLWALLMKWDLDSLCSFKADGHTVHDFDKRFALEEEGKVPVDRTFRWKMIDQQ